MGDILTVQLDAALSAAVALLELVQSEHNYQAILAFRHRPGKTVSLDVLKRRYGLGG
jgi:hypothetical protein